MFFSLHNALRTLLAVLRIVGKFVPAAIRLCIFGSALLYQGSLMAQESITYQQVVQQASPSLQWSAPVALPFGEPLTATQLSAGANIAGSFVYTPAVGEILQPGLQQLSVFFTPSDPNYSSATMAVLIQIIPPGSSSFELRFQMPIQPAGNSLVLSHAQPLALNADVAPIGDFHQPVTLTCTASRPDVQCSFLPSTMRPTQAAIPTVLSVAFHPAHVRQAPPNLRHPRGGFPFSALAFVPALGMFALFRLRRSLIGVQGNRNLLAAIALLPILTVLNGCGVGSFDSLSVTLNIKAASLVETKTQTLTMKLGN